MKIDITLRVKDFIDWCLPCAGILSTFTELIDSVAEDD